MNYIITVGAQRAVLLRLLLDFLMRKAFIAVYLWINVE
jgi:hypothetical protein